MIKTVEAIVDEKGNVTLLEQVRLGVPRRALVTILDEKPAARVSETALLSEATLGEDWNRTEEDEAWSHLQRVPWFSSSFRSPTSRGASYSCGRTCRRRPWRSRAVPGHELRQTGKALHREHGFITSEVGTIKTEALSRVVDAVVALLRPAAASSAEP